MTKIEKEDNYHYPHHYDISGAPTIVVGEGGLISNDQPINSSSQGSEAIGSVVGLGVGALLEDMQHNHSNSGTSTAQNLESDVVASIESTLDAAHSPSSIELRDAIANHDEKMNVSHNVDEHFYQ